MLTLEKCVRKSLFEVSDPVSLVSVNKAKKALFVFFQNKVFMKHFLLWFFRESVLHLPPERNQFLLRFMVSNTEQSSLF